METSSKPSDPSLLCSVRTRPPTSGPESQVAISTSSSPTTANNPPNELGINRPSVSKRKQTKSRNGCVTCKAKRLKCDESKPTCRQCHNRNVTCGGYKKTFKWRQSDNSSFVNKSERNKSEAMSRPSIPPPLSGPAISRESWAFDGGVWPVESDAELHLQPLSLHVPRSDNYFTSTPDAQHENEPASYPSTFSSGQLSKAASLLPPGAQVKIALSNSATESQSPCLQYQPVENHHDSRPLTSLERDDDVEEIVRQSDTPGSPGKSCVRRQPIPGQPIFDLGSPEMLVKLYYTSTSCSLCIRDSPTTNPWRTLMWPLAKDSPPLYHAILGITAFDNAGHYPQLKVVAFHHIRRSLQTLAQEIYNMRIDAALATTILLSYSESESEGTTTGIEHLQGARALVRQAVAHQQHFSVQGADLARLQYLYNAYMYADVITQLTVLDHSGFDKNAHLPFYTPQPSIPEVDPLTGCATTLFPLIGRAALLIQRVRKTKTNSLTMISQALECKTAIEQWKVPSSFQLSDDPKCTVNDCRQTAEAHRWAILLYLYQAFPEIPSEPAIKLAKRVLMHLAKVPSTSQTLLVQLFPLFAASCELEDEEDRAWACERWQITKARFKSGTYDRCVDVMLEVWDRRRAFTQRNQRTSQIPFVTPGERSTHENINGMTSVSPVSSIEFEKTVRGRLHWIGVMTEWKWELMLG